MSAFTNVSVEGYFAGQNGEIDWFKGSDDEEKAFTYEAAKSSATLIFGHTIYEMMAGYWPTPDAVRNDPVLAGVMDSAQKIVFSKTVHCPLTVSSNPLSCCNFSVMLIEVPGMTVTGRRDSKSRARNSFFCSNGFSNDVALISMDVEPLT